jgi:cytoskeleton protein RodZ
MSEVSESAQAETSAGPASAQELSAGAMLRRAREAAGLHVAALAVSLKVPVRKLEALEEDRYDMLTDAVFVRALASSVCRSLKIDAQPVLERLPQMAAPQLVRTSRGLNQPFRAPSDGAPPTWLEQMGQPVFLAVFALLLGALVLIFLPKIQPADEAAAAKPQTPGGGASSIQPAAVSLTPGETLTNVMVQPALAASAPPAATLLPLAAPAKPSSATVTPPQPPKAGASASRVSEAPALAEPMPAAANGILVIRTKAPSWVEVTDAQGAVAVRKVLSAGEEATANGTLPLQVTVGRVDSTEVHLRGKPFDLRPVSRDNVARFEVK